MHWFGELLAFYVLLLAAVGIPAEVRLVRILNLKLKAAKLAYTRLANWRSAYRQLYDANTSAIDAIETGMAPGFPDRVRDQLLAAHDAASGIQQEGNR